MRNNNSLDRMTSLERAARGFQFCGTTIDVKYFSFQETPPLIDFYLENESSSAVTTTQTKSIENNRTKRTKAAPQKKKEWDDDAWDLLNQ